MRGVVATQLLSLQQMTGIRRSSTVHDYTFLIRP
jgi:hypothetical protein